MLMSNPKYNFASEDFIEKVNKIYYKDACQMAVDGDVKGILNCVTIVKRYNSLFGLKTFRENYFNELIELAYERGIESSLRKAEECYIGKKSNEEIKKHLLTAINYSLKIKLDISEQLSKFTLIDFHE